MSTHRMNYLSGYEPNLPVSQACVGVSQPVTSASTDLCLTATESSPQTESVCSICMAKSCEILPTRP